MDEKFDLSIIGGGPGGYVAAIRAAQLGLKVALIEERAMGGTCLNWGCIPTKSLLHGAEVYHTAKTAADYGIMADNVRFDYAKMVAHKDSIVKRLSAGIMSLVKSNSITVVTGKGILKDRNTIEISGQSPRTIKTEKIIIATGSRPFRPSIPGIDGPKVLDSDDVLALTACPEKIVIIGGGVIGVEFATLFNTLGKDVTIIEMMDSILPGIDKEITQMLRAHLDRKGIKIFTSSKVTVIESGATAVCSFENSGIMLRAEGDFVIAAIGRRPNSENLGLEALGVALEKGFIQVNDSMETSVSGIYAIGDITGKVLLAHVASEQGLVAAAHAAGQAKKMNYEVIPGCIYTSPEIATVGLSETEALKIGHILKIGKFPLAGNGKALIMGEKEGLVKIITDEETGEILGTHIMAPKATDMIAEICVAMKLESTIEELAETIHPHPTVSEMLMEAAHDVKKSCVHKPKGK